MKKFFEKLIALTIAIITVFSFTTAIYACDYCPAFSFPLKSCKQTSDESEAAIFVAWVEAQTFPNDSERIQYANVGAGIYLNEEEGHEIQDPGFGYGYLELYMYQNDNLTDVYAYNADYVDLGDHLELYDGSTEFYYSENMYTITCNAYYTGDFVYSPYIINNVTISVRPN